MNLNSDSDDQLIMDLLNNIFKKHSLNQLIKSTHAMINDGASKITKKMKFTLHDLSLYLQINAHDQFSKMHDNMRGTGQAVALLSSTFTNLWSGWGKIIEHFKRSIAICHVAATNQYDKMSKILEDKLYATIKYYGVGLSALNIYIVAQEKELRRTPIQDLVKLVTTAILKHQQNPDRNIYIMINSVNRAQVQFVDANL